MWLNYCQVHIIILFWANTSYMFTTSAHNKYNLRVWFRALSDFLTFSEIANKWSKPDDFSNLKSTILHETSFGITERYNVKTTIWSTNPHINF